MSYVQRQIRLTFLLGNSTFGDTGSNTVTVSGHRVQCHIEKVIGPGTGQAQIRVFGMRPSDMAQLSALTQAAMVSQNDQVIVEAGDSDSGLSVVFQGGIIVGQQCLNTQPETSLFIIANAGASANVQVTLPVSYPGSADVATILSGIASVAGWAFENNGVSMQVQTQYLAGSPMDQLHKVAECGRGRFFYTIDDGVAVDANGQSYKKQTLAIWPAGGARGGSIPLISPDTTMVGYPNYSNSLAGIEVQSVFNPQLTVGGQVRVEVGADCPLKNATGTWGTYQIVHDIESETPGGQWFTRFSTSPQ